MRRTISFFEDPTNSPTDELIKKLMDYTENKRDVTAELFCEMLADTKHYRLEGKQLNTFAEKFSRCFIVR